MRPVLLLSVSLPLLLGGCGEKSSPEGSKSTGENQTAPSEEVKPKLEYEIKGNSVTITDCDKEASGALKIPATIEGKTVTCIGDKAFAFCTSLTSITIPDSVTSIGASAFRSCTALTSITIGNRVTSIGKRAFSGCSSLTTITFLGNKPKVGRLALTGCPAIIYRSPESKGWGNTLGGATVKLIDEAPSEKSIAATPPATTDKKFPSSFKDVVFGSNPVVTDKDKAFWEAAKSGNLEVVQRLLGEGVNVDIYGSTILDYFGCTALFWAAKHNHKKVVQFLLEKNAYIDAGAGMGGTPLHIAAYEGHSEIVELLISEGANTEAKTGDGDTVFDFANEEIAALIRKSIEEKQK